LQIWIASPDYYSWAIRFVCERKPISRVAATEL
jgi:hypothetical protein